MSRLVSKILTAFLTVFLINLNECSSISIPQNQANRSPHKSYSSHLSFDVTRVLNEDRSFLIKELFIDQDTQISSTNPNSNYGEDDFFSVGRTGEQLTSFLNLPDLSGDTAAQSLQLCLHKSHGDSDKFLTLRLVSKEWDEASLTWSESEQKNLISNNVIWFGLITANDGEMQCLDIADQFIQDINTARGVTLYYDDAENGDLSFLSSEGCENSESSFLYCPHWRYITSASTTTTTIFFPQNDAQISSSNPDGNYGLDSSFEVGQITGQVSHALLDTPDFSGKVVLDVELCLSKVQGDTDLSISLKIVNEEWNETSITWNESEEGTMISDETLWSGEIRATDGEMQCLSIEEGKYAEISEGKGVVLIYDDVVESSIIFSSSERADCEEALADGLLYTWHCPHWRYRDMPPTSAPSSPPSSAPTSDLDTYQVGLPEATVISRGRFEVQHKIGINVDPGNVTIELHDYNCVNTLSNTGLEVSIEEIEFVDSPFVYTVFLDESKFAESPGGFVTFHDDVGATGSIAFCTEVASFYFGFIQMATTRVQYNISYDFTDQSLDFNDVEFLPSEQADMDKFEALYGDFFDVMICHCDSSNSCYKPGTSPVIQHGDLVDLCIFPTRNGGDAGFGGIVYITNFNLQLTSNDNSISSNVKEYSFPYDSLENKSGRIKLSTSVSNDFFRNGFGTININVGAFINMKEEKMQTNQPGYYEVEAAIALNIDSFEENCLQQILQGMMKSYFLKSSFTNSGDFFE